MQAGHIGDPRLVAGLAGLAPGGVLRAGRLSLPELLLAGLDARFTGCACFEGGERLLLERGAGVGLERPGRAGVRELADALTASTRLEPEEVASFAAVSGDAAELGRRLVERGLITEPELWSAAAERSYRRLFGLSGDLAVVLKAGEGALGCFVPVALDPHPVIAAGLIRRGRPGGPMTRSVLGRRVSVSQGGELSRGLPARIARAVERLAPPGLVFSDDLGPLGLDPGTGDGVLGWLERLGRLEVRSEDD